MIGATIASLRQEVERACRESLGVTIEAPAIEIPPEPRLGDLAVPVAFELARRLRRAPRDIAQDLAAALRLPAAIARVEVAGAGYLNAFLDRSRFLVDLSGHLHRPPPATDGEKITVEHTNINPNKAAHIGHLRNAVLGDTLVRLLRHLGHPVEVQNYIDDTGVQVADLMVGFEELRHQDAEAVGAIEGRFDHLCWDLYAEASKYLAADPERLKLRQQTLKRLEEREPSARALADVISDRIVRCHLQTMDRIGVRYDLLPWEGDILAFNFWERAFERLRSSGAARLVSEGKNAGCWVMEMGAEEGGSESPEAGGDIQEKILVRSNGTVTYVGKDIAYQMWKFNLLDTDFNYRAFHRYPDGAVIHSTTCGKGDASSSSFGHASRVYNVIDVRQSYLQKVVATGLRAMGYPGQAEQSIHFAYEMVALSATCARELGYKLDKEDLQRPFVEVSGRRGLGVKADDLLDRLEERARSEVRSRHPDLDTEALDSAAHAIALAALRYFMLKYTRNKVIAFDFDEALAFEGETGPYLIYSAVRAANILRKLREREGPAAAEIDPEDPHIDRDYLNSPEGLEHWGLLSALARDRWVARQAVDSLELSLFGKYLFSLAQQFNTFYHHHPVLQEKNPDRRRLRILLTDLFLRQMERGLGLLGIPIPERM
ncbi:MAG: arginine--tRNA ligase [Acidobacteriota bacterium]